MPYVPVPYPRHVKDADGRVVTVKNHIEESKITGIEMQENGYPVGVDAPEPEPTPEEAAKAAYVPKPYPRVVRDADNVPRVVNDHRAEERVTGVAMNEDGTPQGRYIPTPEEILAAGYKEEAVQSIIDREKAIATSSDPATPALKQLETEPEPPSDDPLA